jgi:uncharacterized protein
MKTKASPKASAHIARQRTARGPASEPPPFQQISGHWLLRAFAISLLAAAGCAYLSLCLLFYQGQWQVLFHPSRTVTTTPATLGLRFDDVRFDATEDGVLQLDGWWIPAPAGGRYSNSTLLYFHGAHGSLSDSAAKLKTLHELGINIFAFDYRGFGRSSDTHPSEERVSQDADAAWNYLVDTRHLAAQTIVLFGEGLGATIAAEAARRHSASPGLILENPAPPGLTLVRNDPRTRLLPVRLLFHDRFDLELKLKDLRTAKLFLKTQATRAETHALATSTLEYSTSADPKILVFVPENDPNYLESLRRFLDQQLPPR